MMDVSALAPDVTTLCESLRQATRAKHAQAERSGIMQLLLAGRLRQHDYCRLLRNFHAIYSALEFGLQANRTQEVLSIIYDEALNRVAAIESDLTLLHGDD